MLLKVFSPIKWNPKIPNITENASAAFSCLLSAVVHGSLWDFRRTARLAVGQKPRSIKTQLHQESICVDLGSSGVPLLSRKPHSKIS